MDSSFKRVPTMATILAALQVLDCGSSTEFADMRAAYKSLDPSIQL